MQSQQSYISPNVDLGRIKQTVDAIRENVASVIVGQQRAVNLLLVALLAEGHALLEDVPGMGKTIMARALARSINGSFKRIQCTPDLLPGDITGINYFQQQEGRFVFRPGPIFAQIVLTDEINRATPRTQAALLEAMAERQVTVENETMMLQRPFLVLATQNPVELEGTFPLPEAQLDRFLLRIRLGYPSESDEQAILRRFRQQSPLDTLQPVTDATTLTGIIDQVQHVAIEPVVEAYLLRIVRATRERDDVEMGVSPRGALALARAAQALAAINGRAYVIPDDIRELAVPVLAHRIITTVETRLHGQANDLLIAEVVKHAEPPVETIA